MLKKERFRRFIDYFTEHYPEPKTELNFSNPFELLTAVILSAQCTDKRINQITPALFARFPEPESLAAASSDEVFTYIRSVSYPNNKAKHLVGMARAIMERFGGEIPTTLADLQSLPGVGRKTAHVILSVIYNEPTMAVDTHVFRVSHRLGLAPLTATTPLAVEKALMAHIPKTYVPKAHHWLILHGRYVCLARTPKCDSCDLRDFCKYYEKNRLEL
ncbi:DNA-(apurinic or apyrimidinic site) lyase /endonuclease III [Spirosoma oryzae]|uniref:Endonuclease III n=1 Tax=Spirosoma oryzae TaxID=1469603 RepID=A0A2T0TI03_9BACT|nr:endonuclease III [Spirosoma oryzae]PRY45332.1 DNA-(apurinic or apyrimidinic site) lyase /endonuclease III [Spirosoma oryzae]